MKSVPSQTILFAPMFTKTKVLYLCKDLKREACQLRRSLAGRVFEGIRWGVEAVFLTLAGSHSQEGEILKGIVLNRWAVVW